MKVKSIKLLYNSIIMLLGWEHIIFSKKTEHQARNNVLRNYIIQDTNIQSCYIFSLVKNKYKKNYTFYDILSVKIVTLVIIF